MESDASQSLERLYNRYAYSYIQAFQNSSGCPFCAVCAKLMADGHSPVRMSYFQSILVAKKYIRPLARISGMKENPLSN